MPRRAWTVLLALALCGCTTATDPAARESKEITSGPHDFVPPDCRQGELPAAPHAAEELAAATTDAEADATRLPTLLREAARHLFSHDGKPYDRLRVTVSGYEEPGRAPWFVVVAGERGGGAAAHHEFVVADDGAMVEMRGASGSLPPGDAARYYDLVRNDTAWPRIREVAPYPAGAAWSSAWPGCVRVAFSAQEPTEHPTFPRPEAHAYVHPKNMSVARGGVLLYPSGTTAPPERAA